MNLLINKELDYVKQLSRIKLNGVHFNLNLRAILYSFNQVKLHYNIRDASDLRNYNEIFTDGSKQEHKVGWAFVYYRSGVEVNSYSYRLNNEAIFVYGGTASNI